MNVTATFEIYPDPSLIAASPYGSGPCAPPVATMERASVSLDEKDLMGLLRGGTISRATYGIPKPRDWRVRVGCPFVSCGYHHRDIIYLSSVFPDRENLEMYLGSLGRTGWCTDQEAVAAYGLKMKP